MKALIKVGYRCNHACAFCHVEERRSLEASGAEIHARIERAAQLGHSMVVFSGGEVTLRPELAAWAAHVARLDMDLGLVSNGALLDWALVSTLLAHRLRYVHLSLHGGSAQVHEAVAGAPSFARVLAALRALRGTGVEVWVNCVVTTYNVSHLGELEELVRTLGGVSLKLTFVEARGGAARSFDELVPSLATAAPAMRAALEAARRGTPPLRVAHDGVPLCLLPGWQGARGDLRAHGFASMVEVGEEDLCPVDERNAVRPPVCAPCTLRGRCPGLFLGYFERRGSVELSPVLGGERSNSLTYTLAARLPPPKDAACPVLALGARPFDHARHLFVRNGERLALFHTATRDFCDEDIAAIKHDTGQIYVDVSHQDAPDDFARQLVKVARSSLCEACPTRQSCTGLFEPVLEDVFSRDDARVLELLASLEGDVVDIGSGEARYGAALAVGAQAGRLRYTAVEPDAARVAELRARWPWAKVVHASAEAFAPDTRPLDHVLVLRSWNHLREPALVLPRLVEALRPGGTLLLVDNVAYALLRTRAQTERAERSTSRFEHFRVDGASEACALLDRLGLGARLQLVERREVGPQTSNQWLLRYVRLGSLGAGSLPGPSRAAIL